MLIAGTTHITAKILIWDICSKTCQNIITLNNASSVLVVKFAYDNRHICAAVLHHNYS